MAPAFSGEILVQVRVPEIRFESEIPVVFRSADPKSLTSPDFKNRHIFL